MSLPDRHGLALEIAASAGADALLAADPATVHWLTGVAADVEPGPSPFAPSPAVVLAPSAPALLIISADDAPAQAPDGMELRVYEGFTTGPLLGPRHAVEWAEVALVGRRRVAVDGLAARGLVAAASGAAAVDVAGALRDTQAVKDAQALAAIRAALAVADAGQAAARAALGPGTTEIELFGAVRAAMEAAAGARVPVLADLVSGPRTAGMGGAPSARALAPGELVLCDLAPRVAGTWGDSCATLAVGEPPAAARSAYRQVRDALERAMERVRPGAVAGDVDAAVRAGLDYPHHTGHGIGSSYHEAPRLVPGDPTVLREGMVIALEPALYADDFGIRLEHVVHVTAGGCEDLSTHGLELQ